MICDMNRSFIAALWRLGLLAVVGLTSWTAQAQIQVQKVTQTPTQTPPQTQTRIQSVSGSLQAGVEMVKIDFQGPLPARPAVFSTPSPARIAMDFERVSNGTGQTFRIETHQVEERRKSPVSLMPTGLLKDLTSTDYADLFAHLQTLTATKESKPVTP